jgi:hypothetical protein
METKARDQFERYYTEKLWQLLPAIYRHEDGLAANPHVLRAIVEVMAKQAAILRRSQDRLWDDQFIELCDDWAVPYIGDLVGTRLLSAMLTRARKIDVAKTIYYRRRKGTPRVLEELISDISQWDGKLVEGFQRLVRARHGLDPFPDRFAGFFTGTMPGGFADIRSAAASELCDGPFEEYYHLPDMRKPRGFDGRFGITKLDFYLYRLQSFAVTEVTPFALPDGVSFLFDPSGRNIPLFNKRKRPAADQWDQWHSAFEWELPLPIRCRLLGHATYSITDDDVQQLVTDGLISPAAATELRNYIGYPFRKEEDLRTFLGTLSHSGEFLALPAFNALLQYTITEHSGKYQLIPDALLVETGNPLTAIEKENIVAAALTGPGWNIIAPAGKILAIDAEQGRFKFLTGTPATPVAPSYHYGFSGPYGAGTYDRRTVEDSAPTLIVLPGVGTIGAAEMQPQAVVQVNDNTTYFIQADHVSIIDYTLQAANQKRPYLVLSADWILSSGSNQDACLVLDGLWIGAVGGSQCNIRLQGDFECVTIRNCTFDPGNDTNALGQPILPVSLHIEGNVETLCIERSIMGPISIQANGIIEDAARITGSIIQSEQPGTPAIQLHTGILYLNRSTVFGELEAHRLFASEALISGQAMVDDTQTGCFRFGAAPANSQLPKPYESFLFTTDNNYWFVSRRFGQPGYAQLSETAPAALLTGAENGAEMGAFNQLLNALKQDGLKTKIEEYMPFGLIPAFINIT